MLSNTNFKDIMTKTQTNNFFIACRESRIETTTSFYGCFYLGPFEESFSQTLANDLRRTLLSELNGLAITSIEIEGVLHKFSTLSGMKESILDLICNLQNIVIRKNTFSAGPSKKTYTGFLKVSGPRIIKALDLKLPPSLQCIDPNQYIATLADDGVLNMKFNINEGKNYIKQKPYNLDINALKKRNILLQNFKKYLNQSNIENENNIYFNKKQSKKLSLSTPIPLDAVFMPVTKVNCIIEENNLYSDFSTDININQELENTNSPVYKLYNQRFFDFLDYNSVYQTSLLLKTKSVDNLKVTKQLIPWQSNSLYYNITATDNLTPIKNFLGSKPIIKTNYQNKLVIRSLFTNLEKSSNLKSINSYKKIINTLKKSPKSVIKNTISAHNVAIGYLNLEYSKFLKLKPLRKKSQLIVEIWTNGSIHPREALFKSFEFLTNNFLKLQNIKMFGSMFKSELIYGNIKASYFNNYLKNQKNRLTQIKAINFKNVSKNIEPTSLSKTTLTSTDKNITLFQSIGLLNISLRTYTVLKKAGIFTLNDLLNYSKKDLLDLKNLGSKSLYEIEINLAKLGFTLKN